MPELEEQRVILTMIEMRDAGFSLRDIAAGLNDSGVPSKRGEPGIPRRLPVSLDPPTGTRQGPNRPLTGFEDRGTSVPLIATTL